MSEQIKEYWDRTSVDYQRECDIPIRIHYGNGAPFEDELNLLGDIKGKRILDFGCGGGQCSIAMVQRGAIVTGIDISIEQIIFARELAVREKTDVDFSQYDGQDLSLFEDESYDLVFSAWALLYIGDLDQCFKGVHRILKQEGNFAFSLPHPFYRTIDPETLKLKESYFESGRSESQEKLPDGTTIPFLYFKHKFSDVLNALIGANMTLEKVIEPDSRIHYEGDPWYGKWDCNPKLMNHIPPTVIFKTKKS